MNKMRIFGVAIAGSSLILAAVLGAGSAQSAPSNKLEQVLSRGKLIVGTGSDSPPWHFIDEKGKLVGMDIDVARIVAKGLFDDPSKVEFVQETSDSRIPNVVTDKVDMVCHYMTVTAQRAQKVAFTIPYYREGVSFLMSSKSKYKDYAALLKAGSKAKVGILQNVYAEDLAHQGLPKATVLQYASQALAWGALDSGRVDAVATDTASAAWLSSRNKGKYKDSGFAYAPNSYSCAVAQGDQVWLNFVNQAINEAMSGEQFSVYQASFKKWFGTTLPQPKIGFPRP